MKKMNNKGFTLMEVLIVVAIIAVLIAIAIPVFGNQLEKAREAVDAANLRSAYAEVVAEVMLDGSSEGRTVIQKQTKANWATTFAFPGNFTVANPDGTTGKWDLSWDAETEKVVTEYTTPWPAG
jgi:prepilin-type N-terminal cleavage/methylation domain-containing protein